MGRTIITTWLDLARRPLDSVVRVLPDGERGPRTTVVSLLDRADASVRETLGGLLRDDVLRADGRRRHIAAHERGRALELRTEAAVTRAEADARAVAQIEAAEERREQARRDAEAEREAAAKLKAEREAAQAKAAAVREQAVEDARRKEQEAVEKKAKRQRLDVLEDKTGALESESEAVVARDEAERLRKAAATAKASRKNGT